ncbi:gas vesicle accessory protein GvpU [Pseudomonas sp. dw_358]|uniref:gas vesicle accessory protein GvpU n=1 Tax=Pseudomonas sp. dw_358 TaxID=2720083 RepID=UPI001BD30D19|nr:gas vesicle accessory protein GvpU [Pseudomonas sp. dw_358]
MTDSTAASSTDSAQAVLGDTGFLKQEWEGRQTDWLLQWFVQFVNKTPVEVGITLSIGGGLVSGILISHHQYFEELAADFSKPFEAFAGPEAEHVKELVLGFIAPPTPPGEKEPAMQFLHLRDARLYSAGGGEAIPTKGALWRGKISAVDGFSMGGLSANQ